MSENTKKAEKKRWPDRFTPKFFSVLGEGYGFDRFRRDSIAGLTVAMVAIPLSMAIAKASGASPDRGLVTAIVGGFLISLLGGSRFQIGGPAGAFIVVVASIIERQGFDGLLLATMMAGVLMIGFGVLQLGSYIKYIPHPVLVGFTTGIATIIFSSQIVDLFGLTLSGREPAALLPKLKAIAGAAATVNLAAVAVSLFALAVILILRRTRPHWPGFLIAIALASLLASVLAKAGLPIETIGTRFGGIPNALPAPSLPGISLEKLRAVLPDALTIAFLGAVESLLSAVVADGMSGRRHRSNIELVAQGVANIASALFGGICATGTIARTATNDRSGATSPVAGIVHALALLLLVYLAAPLASYVPLASLGAILALVSWNMAEHRAFAAILRLSKPDAVILLATFLLTIFRDLTEGIAAGVVLAAFVFMHHMAAMATVGRVEDEESETGMDTNAAGKTLTFRIEGPFFYGVASEIAEVLERIGDRPEHFVLDLSGMPFCDMTAAHALKGVIAKLETTGVAVTLTGARPEIAQALNRFGVRSA